MYYIYIYIGIYIYIHVPHVAHAATPATTRIPVESDTDLVGLHAVTS